MVRRLLDTEHRAIPALREALMAAGFDDDTLMKTMGAIEVPTTRKRTLPRLLKRTEDPTPLNTVQRCFLFRVPVARKSLADALAPASLESLEQMGLLEVDGDSARALVALYPLQELVFAVDNPDTVHDYADSVMPVNSTTTAMIYATIRRNNGSALDVGCGCGAQALFAAQHSNEVYATDLNARAVNFTAFNARLNGLENVQSVQGSGYEPVGDKRFDLMVGNLPYAIIPGGQYVYRDSGEPLDSFVSRMISNAPDHLNEGGYCQYLCDWIEFEGEPWQNRFQPLAQMGCDTLAVVVESNDPIQYAERWLEETEPPGNDLELFQRWTAFYEQHRIKNIHRGWMNLRRRSSGANWFQSVEAPAIVSGAWGDTIVQVFAGKDFLNGLGSPDEVLNKRLVLAHGVELVQAAEVHDGRWMGTKAQLIHNEGLRNVADVNQHSIALLPRFDGQHTVLEVLSAFAKEHGAPVERVIAPCLPLLTHLIERGILLPL